MITNTGKGILAKYLIGQAPAYASYIAVGCGATPLASDGVLGDYSAKERLDFEMFRVPIISRGYVNEDGVSKIVFTGELPTEERYEITEVGVYSAGSNPSAGLYDSKMIYSFTQNESWEYHNPTTAVAIPTIYAPLDSDDDGTITGEYTINGVLTETPVFQTNADNRLFTDSSRIARYESCRFLNNVIAMSGASSTLNVSNGHLQPANGSSHIHLTGVNLDLNKNSPTDQLKLAFSVVSKDADGTAPDSVRILLEFSSSDVHNDSSGQYARFEVNLSNGTNAGQHNFDDSRYVVVAKDLKDLYKSSGFTWNTVDVIKVYVSAIKNGSASGDFYVFLDALRLDNTSVVNSLYGLTGYSVIRNTDSKTVTKLANTTNFIEFRFAMDVQ
jgi:hypothetical protein